LQLVAPVPGKPYSIPRSIGRRLTYYAEDSGPSNSQQTAVSTASCRPNRVLQQPMTPSGVQITLPRPSRLRLLLLPPPPSPLSVHSSLNRWCAASRRSHIPQPRLPSRGGLARYAPHRNWLFPAADIWLSSSEVPVPVAGSPNSRMRQRGSERAGLINAVTADAVDAVLLMGFCVSFSGNNNTIIISGVKTAGAAWRHCAVRLIARALIYAYCCWIIASPAYGGVRTMKRELMCPPHPRPLACRRTLYSHCPLSIS
jgi:hypothetical protein